MTTLSDYITAKRQAVKKIPADISERWQSRVVARGLHTLGASGATQYLSDYGRGIAAPKVIALALKAEAEGCAEMALEFWRKAYHLETGNVSPANVTAPDAPAAVAQAPQPSASPRVEGLPKHLQPGQIITMQPVDAPHEREWYITNDRYWAQRKYDGNRLVVIATPQGVFYQSRSTNLRAAPSNVIDKALKAAVGEFGSFVLDGELFYPDAAGKDHRTGAQAATANADLGQPHVQPQAVYAIFKALFHNGKDLTAITEFARIMVGEKIGTWLEALELEVFEVALTARTTEEKRQLVAQQQAEGREGEVWVRHDCKYVGGKDSQNYPIVRTKYLEELDVLVTGLTPTTAEGRPFGALEVATLEGKPLGAVGTGFDSATMREIVRRYAATQGSLRVTIATQGFTENGLVWHGRFVNFVN